jgi:nucleotide-binding universal stress UspA family protein
MVASQAHGKARAMNSIQHILVHVGESPRAAVTTRLAASVAGQHGATLSALYAVEPMPTGAYMTPEAATIAAGLNLEAEDAKRQRAQALVATAAASTGMDIPFERLGGDPLEQLLRRARTADLLVLGQRDPQNPDGTSAGFAGRVLMGAGCPVLFMPYADDAGGEPTCGTRVLVAWADTRESARALRDALPLLRHAELVELVRFARAGDSGPEPLEEVAAHLARHGVAAGCTVRHSRQASIGERMLSPWTPDAPVAEALLSQAADMGADLIVMGGYGHSRAWELALGGVTRTVLQSMTVPVLMSH